MGIFGPGIFSLGAGGGGGGCWRPQGFLGFWFTPHSIISVTWNLKFMYPSLGPRLTWKLAWSQAQFIWISRGNIKPISLWIITFAQKVDFSLGGPILAVCRKISGWNYINWKNNIKEDKKYIGRKIFLRIENRLTYLKHKPGWNPLVQRSQRNLNPIE